MKIRRLTCDHIFIQKDTIDLQLVQMGVIECKKCKKNIFFQPKESVNKDE